jgi:predicted DNA-binding transcriptional regulator YafY
MTEFQISKRTALRDVMSLEEIGAPIYVEYGRNGGYRVLNKMQLPPISFNTQEIYALYLSIQALKSFSNLPFAATYQSIDEKFYHALSVRQRENIERIQNRVTIYQTKQLADCPCLETMMLALIEQKVLSIYYKNTKREIQPIGIHATKGYWYCQSYDLNRKAYRVFRCDRITDAQLSHVEPLTELADITLVNSHVLWKTSDQAVSFNCSITEQGVRLFLAEQYPSMKIHQEDGHTYLTGWYESHELDFIINFLSRFGRSIKIIAPNSLKEHMKAHYINLINDL